MMSNIYENIIPRLQVQVIGNNRVFANISLNALIDAIAEYKGIPYVEEYKNFEEYKNSLSNIKDLDFNEFDEYEEVK